MRDAFLDEMHTFATLVALCAAACGGMTNSGTSQSGPGTTGGRSGGGSGSAGRAAGGSSGGSPGVISNGGGTIFQPPPDPPPPDPPPQCAPVVLRAEFGDAATCSWKVPPPPPRQKFMSNLVNLQFDSGDGGSRAPLYHVRTPADCGAARDSWYYDNEESPTYLALCPETCRRFSSTPVAPQLYVVFGCSGPLPL